MQLALSGHNMCIVGTAGTGKSYLIQQIVRELREKGQHVMVGTPTGVSATVLSSVQAQTIHSMCGMLDGRFTGDQLLKRVRFDECCLNIKNDIMTMDTLVLDEVSMISACTFDKVCHLFQGIRGNHKPFDGVQVVAVLDPRQLPPIPDTLYGDDGKFPFESQIWTIAVPHIVHLVQVYRQHDDTLDTLIQDTFSGTLSVESVHMLDWLSRPLQAENLSKVYFSLPRISTSTYTTASAWNRLLATFGCTSVK